MLTPVFANVGKRQKGEKKNWIYFELNGFAFFASDFFSTDSYE